MQKSPLHLWCSNNTCNLIFFVVKTYILYLTRSSVSDQVPDLLQVASALKEQAARVGDSRLTPTFTSAPRGSETRRQKTSEIWTSIYSAAGVAQARIVQFFSGFFRLCGLYQTLALFVSLGNAEPLVQIQRQRRQRPEEFKESKVSN